MFIGDISTNLWISYDENKGENFEKCFKDFAKNRPDIKDGKLSFKFVIFHSLNDDMFQLFDTAKRKFVKPKQ